MSEVPREQRLQTYEGCQAGGWSAARQKKDKLAGTLPQLSVSFRLKQQDTNAVFFRSPLSSMR
jgi:hypothetical protein